MSAYKRSYVLAMLKNGKGNGITFQVKATSLDEAKVKAVEFWKRMGWGIMGETIEAIEFKIY